MQVTCVAVTYSELFKRAAMLANSKMQDDARLRPIFPCLKTCFSSADAQLENLKIKFAEIDTNGDGLLGVVELAKFCSSFGKPIEKNVIQQMVRLSDSDRDGKLSFDEFYGILRRAGIGKTAQLTATL